LEKLTFHYPVSIDWRSYELRPAGGPPISPEYRAQILAARPQMKAMARERYGLEINEGPFGINSRPSLIGAKFAEAEGQGAAYHAAVFRAYWQEAQDISETAVLANIAATIGLPAAAYLAALEDETYQQHVAADIQQAFAFGISAVPALVFNRKYLVSGAQPYEMLAQVTEKALNGE